MSTASRAGRPLILGGVTIPSEFGLDGHSDADILLHAITDALLGAAALGDIGMHFPDTDPQWKGAASPRFLEHAADWCASQRIYAGERGYDGDSGNPQAQELSAAHPRISGARAGAAVDRVSVKFKTAEGVGPVGQGLRPKRRPL